MPLLALWESNPGAVSQMTAQQVLMAAGDGQLRDDSKCSSELRQFLKEVSTEQLGHYAEQCLQAPFEKSGLVLQDIVNELGRRLEYQVTNGRYQGKKNAIGFDGIWERLDNTSIVVEVKSTDTYRISLDNIAGYCEKLNTTGVIASKPSVLIVVGREDTGELEAQVRGSKHAWDMRLISVDSLLSLVRIKESTDAVSTSDKIRSILLPREYTRLDSLIDVMFTTAKDVEATAESAEPASAMDSDSAATDQVSGWEFTPSATIQEIRGSILASIGKLHSRKLIKRSRALHWDAAHELRVACTISKRHQNRADQLWYAYHPAWDEFLGDGSPGILALGGVGMDRAFAIPVDVMRAQLAHLNVTNPADGKIYWHIKVNEADDGKFWMLLPKIGAALSLSPFEIAI